MDVLIIVYSRKLFVFMGGDLVDLLLYSMAQMDDPKTMKENRPRTINHLPFASNIIDFVYTDLQEN
ncbi:AAEL006869-PA [Aedes aegypti]|uniref:AAEL006869-PA n=1 Tax=Aedes aegypti TaxID=7159 RepID=Q174L4_AEDAE|nr:AAEL006869-PA [Aedes aegypti]